MARLRGAAAAAALLLAIACGRPSGAWVEAAAPPIPLDGGAPGLALEADGDVLLAGGDQFGARSASVFEFIVARSRWVVAGTLPEPRAEAASAPLPGGGLVIAGGYSDRAPLDTAAVHEPGSGWTDVRMPAPRAEMTAVALGDASVLLVGGVGPSGAAADAWIYDAREHTFHIAASMARARVRPAAVLLPDGTVLVAGGDVGSGRPPAQSTAEIFDPDSRTWAAVRGPDPAAGTPRLAVLPDGSVLAVQGAYSSGGFGRMSCSLEPRASSRWHAIPCPPDPLLATDLLVARGQAYLVALRVTDGATVAARYDPADGSWHEGPALAAGDLPAASLVLRDGRLLVLDRGLYGVYDPDQEGYPSEGGTFASPAVTEWESGIAVLLLALLALRWWRSAAQRTSGRGREIG